MTIERMEMRALPLPVIAGLLEWVMERPIASIIIVMEFQDAPSVGVVGSSKHEPLMMPHELLERLKHTVAELESGMSPPPTTNGGH